MVISGKILSDEMAIELEREVSELKNKNIIPRLAIITLGDEESWSTYVGAKIKMAGKIGVDVELLNLKAADEKMLFSTIEKINNDPSIHGLIVQRPFPSKYDKAKIIYSIQKEKDIDGFREDSMFQVPVFLAVEKIITHIERLLEATEVRNSPIRQSISVIGKGETAGFPVIKGLEKMGLNPKVVDSSTKDRKEILKNSKIIITAVGQGKIISKDEVSQGVILIGIGLHRGENGRLMGDFDEKEMEHIASFYTPTPGGIGPLNLAYLFDNLIKAAKIQK